MGKPIVHHNGWFFVWSTIVDAPVTKAMRRAEFESFYRECYGSEGMKELPARLERAIAKGTSSFDGESAEDLIAGNRAGNNEEELSFYNVLSAVGITVT